ncbi:MAG TPA: heparinase II/III family protein, partial [Phycisphaerae bacterium]|nr:heparinase II/III family protein [Phycisphaerae bacterium]
GYPDFANSTTPGRFAWTSNTVSHNTVMVDGGPQTGNDRGNVLRFHRGDQVSVVDVDAATSYPQTTKYRRQLVLVEAGDDAYLVDVFRVAGGGNHVLSLHGHEGTFSLTGPTLSAVNTQGTLAGSNVPYGTNSGMPSGPPNYNSFFSGYSFMYNWQTAAHTGNVATATWNHADGNMLRVHLGPNAGQELVVTDARVSPLLKIPAIFKYLLVRRPGDANGTTFTSVWELTDNPIATGPVTVTTGAGSGADRTVIVKVPRGSVTDTIAVAPQPGNVFTIEAGLTSNAAVTMLSRSGLTLTRSFVAGGSTVAGTQNISVPATLSGTIATANYATKTITANLGASTVNAASLVGKSVRIYNPMHSSLWTIGAATRTGAVLTLTLDGAEVFNGRIKPTMIETHANENVYDVLTNTSMLYPEDMPGMYLVTLDLAAASRIQTTYSVNRYGLGAGANFAPYAAAIANGEDLWIADFGVGDTIEIERFTQSGS